jgi:lysylphosphatidylglycerol synthetase-like protein (DUF2156 family)
MSGRRAKAVRREARRRGFDPLNRIGRTAMVSSARATSHGERSNPDRRAYRRLKREVVR